MDWITPKQEAYLESLGHPLNIRLTKREASDAIDYLPGKQLKRATRSWQRKVRHDKLAAKWRRENNPQKLDSELTERVVAGNT